MGVRSSQPRSPNLNKTDGHLIEFFRNALVGGGGGTNAPGGPAPGLAASGGIVNEYTSGPVTYRAHVFTTTGEFEVTSLGGLGNTIDYLVVGGGGGGGTSGGGGGGAGLLRYIEDQPVAVGPYAVTIGAGGAGAKGPQNRGVQGGTTTLALPSSVTCPGGGGGGGVTGFDAGGAGGAGGGGAGGSGAGGTGAGDPGHPGGVDVESPANGWGGDGGDSIGVEEAGGGGGAGGDGETRPTPYSPPYTAGTGGLGARYTTAGSANIGVGAPGPGSPGNNWFAGGGGARSAGTGGGGGGTTVGNSWSGGGSGANLDRTNGSDGTPGSGGGGGGTGNTQPGFNGGAGVVVVRYKIADSDALTAKATGGNISFYDDSGTIRALHVFTGTQPFQVTNGPVNCSFFIVAGGGGAGYDASGGGGAGGVVFHPGLTVADGTYTVTVGAGGLGATQQPTKGSPGTDSSIAFPTSYTAYRGGGGGSRSSSAGASGGSGGGGARTSGSGGSAEQPASNPGATESGNSGGSAGTYGAGGGGAGNAGEPYDNGNAPGAGGIGIQAPPVFRNPEVRFGANIPGGDPSGADWAFAGGGGGGGDAGAAFAGGGSYTGSARAPGGPFYGGGDGGRDPDSPNEFATAGKTNTGGGGGGGGNGPNAIGAPGGSGIVLISYPIS